MNRPRRSLTAAMDLLLSYDWPGNVRELENAVERALLISREPEIQPQDFPFQLHPVNGDPGALARRSRSATSSASCAKPGGTCRGPRASSASTAPRSTTRSCDDWRCIMSPAHSVERIDIRSAEYCAQCNHLVRGAAA
jgi:DNA-binding NtrC family response regulator